MDTLESSTSQNDIFVSINKVQKTVPGNLLSKDVSDLEKKIELSIELAKIALQCEGCSALFKQVLQKYDTKSHLKALSRCPNCLKKVTEDCSLPLSSSA